MARQLESEIDEAFFDALKKEGFDRRAAEPLSYVRTSPDGLSRAYVDVEVRDYLSGFGVTLQETRVGGATRRQLLEDFQGLRAYGFDERAPTTVIEAVAQALADLQFYGLPWLAGQVVSTPAVEQIRQLAGDRGYRDAVFAAREEFKAGRYAEALKLFEEASRLRALDVVDEKFRALAEKKAASG